MMSALPSPLKSPTCTSTQVANVLQVVHTDMVKQLPLDKPTHQVPVLASRAAMSVKPSPLNSPETTSTQVTLGSKAAHREELKDEPVDTPVQIWPDWLTRPTISLGSVTVAVVVVLVVLPPTSLM